MSRIANFGPKHRSADLRCRLFCSLQWDEVSDFKREIIALTILLLCNIDGAALVAFVYYTIGPTVLTLATYLMREVFKDLGGRYCGFKESRGFKRPRAIFLNAGEIHSTGEQDLNFLEKFSQATPYTTCNIQEIDGD